MSLAKFIAKMKAGAGDVGRAGLGLGALGLMKGVEKAAEHPKAAKGLAAGAGIGGLAAIIHGMGSSKGSESAWEEDKHRMAEKYPDEADDIMAAYDRNKKRR